MQTQTPDGLRKSVREAFCSTGSHQYAHDQRMQHATDIYQALGADIQKY